MAAEARRGEFVISTDPARLRLDVIRAALAGSYWAEGIPREVVARSLRHSLCFGVYEAVKRSAEAGRNAEARRSAEDPDGNSTERQVGFARVISDHATFGYLGDVFILPAYQGRGLGKWLMEVVFAHPELQGFRRWMLATRDAHGLYERHGFRPLAQPEDLMEIVVPDIYRRPEHGA